MNEAQLGAIAQWFALMATYTKPGEVWVRFESEIGGAGEVVVEPDGTVIPVATGEAVAL